MKAILFSALLIVTLAGVSIAQDATYIDSVQASGVTNANTHTQGFAAFKLLPSDYNTYGFRRISFFGFNTTDSIKIQGAILNRVGATVDTIWRDVRITERMGPSLNNPAMSRDSSYYWFSNVGRVAADAHYTSSPAYEIPYGYDLYRVCTGKNDSGEVFMRSMLWEATFGYSGPAFMQNHETRDYVACYFEHQRA